MNQNLECKLTLEDVRRECQKYVNDKWDDLSQESKNSMGLNNEFYYLAWKLYMEKVFYEDFIERILMEKTIYLDYLDSVIKSIKK